jgi:gamma-glutamyltranspeptidase/glutathione hydrolase
MRSGRTRLVQGDRGAAATGHPIATGVAQSVLASQGNAVDAAIAAQAVLCVLLPQSCGLGGDGLTIVRHPDGTSRSYLGAGVTPAAGRPPVRDDGSSVTVPGVVHAWQTLAREEGTLPLGELLTPAGTLAEEGAVLGRSVGSAVLVRQQRLERGGAAGWEVVEAGSSGRRIPLQALARTLGEIGKRGADAFYRGPLSEAIASAVRRDGGSLTTEDLAEHATPVGEPIDVSWAGGVVRLMPPPSQAVLLGCALVGLERLAPLAEDLLDHVCVELIQLAFVQRGEVHRGRALLEQALEIDLDRASRRSGPRGYLHTVGVATADREGTVVASLVSLFDDFGSGTFVPEGGFVLNNRAASFTDPPNHYRPGTWPVHTLSPILIERGGAATALATPGADGQVQTLLQVLVGMVFRSLDLPAAVARPRWRSEEGRLLVEESLGGADRLASLGHDVHRLPDGADRFGALVAAGIEDGIPFAVADHRREAWAGAV